VGAPLYTALRRLPAEARSPTPPPATPPPRCRRIAAATAGAGGARGLDVTYNRWLLDHARRLFAGLPARSGGDGAHPAGLR